MHNVNIKYYYYSISLIRMCTVTGQMLMGNEDGMRSSKSLHIYSRRIHNRDLYSSGFFLQIVSSSNRDLQFVFFSTSLAGQVHVCQMTVCQSPSTHTAVH